MSIYIYSSSVKEVLEGFYRPLDKSRLDLYRIDSHGTRSSAHIKKANSNPLLFFPLPHFPF
jgi:hypothetical protein